MFMEWAKLTQFVPLIGPKAAVPLFLSSVTPIQVDIFHDLSPLPYSELCFTLPLYILRVLGLPI